MIFKASSCRNITKCYYFKDQRVWVLAVLHKTCFHTLTYLDENKFELNCWDQEFLSTHWSHSKSKIDTNRVKIYKDKVGILKQLQKFFDFRRILR